MKPGSESNKIIFLGMENGTREEVEKCPEEVTDY
jgi:hypothetical protein